MDSAPPPPVRDAQVLGDLITRERRTGATALSAPGDPDRAYDYRRLSTTAQKAANLLRHLGVRGVGTADGDEALRTVAVAPDPDPEPLLTALGAARLGAAVRFEPRTDCEARVVAVHADDAARYDPPPGTKLVAYGGPPDDPSVEHWEEQVWSENPAAPPAAVDPGDTALVADRRHTHAELLAAARAVVDRLGLGPGDSVAVRSSLSDPRTVAAGVVAPLLVGGVICLPDEGARGDAAVGPGPEPDALSLDDVPL